MAIDIAKPTSIACSFAPVETVGARILILGSVPGQASLNAQEYYAHRRNAFWPIMAELLQFDQKAPYFSRLEALQKNNIALWDVLQSCMRPGSLDSSIERSSLVINDFRSFLGQHSAIRQICFNGATAEIYFQKYVASTLPTASISYSRLPSTSPAHAALSFEQKLQAWRSVLLSPTPNA